MARSTAQTHPATPANDRSGIHLVQRVTPPAAPVALPRAKPAVRSGSKLLLVPRDLLQRRPLRPVTRLRNFFSACGHSMLRSLPTL